MIARISLSRAFQANEEQTDLEIAVPKDQVLCLNQLKPVLVCLTEFISMSLTILLLGKILETEKFTVYAEELITLFSVRGPSCHAKDSRRHPDAESSRPLVCHLDTFQNQKS